MELINEIAKRGFIVDDWAAPYVNGIRGLLLQAVPCDITNVAEWLHANPPPPKKSYARISPMFLMPHDVMWFEYPILEFTDNLHGWEHFGLLMLHHSIQTEIEDPEAYAGAYAFVKRHERNVPKLLCCTLRFRHGENGQELNAINSHMHEHGRIKLADSEDLSNQIDDDESVEKIIVQLTLPALAAMTFFHCPNVRVVNRWPSKAHAAAFKAKHGVALRVMKEIEIHAPREVSKAEGIGMPRGASAAHFVRGHFKRYNNLFGSIRGVFFWRPHVRGEGEPLPRSYNVHGPTNKHHGKCVVTP